MPMPSVLWRCWLGGRKSIRPVKNWAVGCWRGYALEVFLNDMRYINPRFTYLLTYLLTCLERDAGLHMAQLMPLPLTDSCFSKIQIGFTFLVPAHPGSPGKRAVKRVCVCVCVIIQNNKLCILFPFTTVLCTLTTACSMSKFEFKQKYVQWKKSSQTTDKTVHIVAALPSIGCHRGLEPFTRLVNCFVNDWLLHPRPDVNHTWFEAAPDSVRCCCKSSVLCHGI